MDCCYIDHVTARYEHLPYVSSVGINDAVDHTYNDIKEQKLFQFCSRIESDTRKSAVRIAIPTPENLQCVYIEAEGGCLKSIPAGLMIAQCPSFVCKVAQITTRTQPKNGWAAVCVFAVRCAA